METKVKEVSQPLLEKIVELRRAYAAIDFDTALWDSLFGPIISASALESTQNTANTLHSVLETLKLDSASIPQDFLQSKPANEALEALATEHAYLHDSLLQALTMALARYTSALFEVYIHETASSVEEVVKLMDGAIHLLTQINCQQFHPPTDENIADTTILPATYMMRKHPPIVTPVKEEDDEDHEEGQGAVLLA
jgi:hypothetical protein